ncbi:hypothetical protein ACFU8W_32615 [Streptomyces sp. NPDC057565]|uniref:hypothetical protein n=1 Tax=Streptomyces sp. NPDC057565 TaxID=3346169 RepID=UPI0036A5A82F
MVHFDDGFDFLGHHIRRQRKRGTNKRYVYTRPFKKAVQAVKDRIPERTYRNTQNQGLTQLPTGLPPRERISRRRSPRDRREPATATP